MTNPLTSIVSISAWVICLREYLPGRFASLTLDRWIVAKGEGAAAAGDGLPEATLAVAFPKRPREEAKEGRLEY